MPNTPLCDPASQSGEARLQQAISHQNPPIQACAAANRYCHGSTRYADPVYNAAAGSLAAVSLYLPEPPVAARLKTRNRAQLNNLADLLLEAQLQ
ncbi:hypothetical protein D3C73_1385430 [compost metagenome]